MSPLLKLIRLHRHGWGVRYPLELVNGCLDHSFVLRILRIWNVRALTVLPRRLVEPLGGGPQRLFLELLLFTHRRPLVWENVWRAIGGAALVDLAHDSGIANARVTIE